MTQAKDTPVHSGNYYTTGAQRVLAKLGEMKIAVPAAALDPSTFHGSSKPILNFTRFEHAILDWFEGRDYDQTQALIHFKPPRDEWQVIRLLDEEKGPSDLTRNMLCPSRLDAVAAIINACDIDTMRLENCRKEDEAIVVTIQGVEVVRVEPIQYEPFELEIRDRVRTAFKGVRHWHYDEMLQHAARLPGFKAFAPKGKPREGIADACMFLGFPANWAFAMRSALKQVGIAVKQSQAQELAAVLFGAANWHQLVRHQDEVNERMKPVAIEGRGTAERFYHTSEEALFAAGKIIEANPEPVILETLSTATDYSIVTCRVVKEKDLRALPPEEQYLCESWLTVGYNDYWSLEDYGSEKLSEAARRMLQSLDEGAATGTGTLYAGGGDAALLEGALGRMGIPPEQIVYVGDHALAVEYVPDPDGGQRTAAKLQVFRITPEGPRAVRNGTIAMYKAKTRVIQDASGVRLEIRADYGNDAPIVIPVAHMRQLEQLKALTHRHGIFTFEEFDLGESGRGDPLAH